MIVDFMVKATLRQHPNFNSEHNGTLNGILNGTLNGTLNPTQWKVLQFITLHQGTNAQHIIDELTIPRDTLNKVLKHLNVLNLIERRGGKKDGGYYLCK
ncbi:MAG: MarR family transcriptional regulator [Bacteroidales bacterium]|nr:MarR family transcriptional regulator [Bacteroidales bacterium]